MTDSTITITGKENLAMVRLITLRAALKLECLGMTKHGQSAYAMVKQEFGLKGNKRNVYAQFNSKLVEQGAIDRPL